MASNKSDYKLFCEEEEIPLFLQYDWFNTLYKDQEWDVAVEKKGGETIGVLPYVITKKKSFKIITPQYLSPYQGVWIKYPKGQKYASKLGYEKEVINGLINQIPNVDAFNQNFYRGLLIGCPLVGKVINSQQDIPM